MNILRLFQYNLKASCCIYQFTNGLGLPQIINRTENVVLCISFDMHNRHECVLNEFIGFPGRCNTCLHTSCSLMSHHDSSRLSDKLVKNSHGHLACFF